MSLMGRARVCAFEISAEDFNADTGMQALLVKLFLNEEKAQQHTACTDITQVGHHRVSY